MRRSENREDDDGSPQFALKNHTMVTPPQTTAALEALAEVATALEALADAPRPAASPTARAGR